MSGFDLQYDEIPLYGRTFKEERKYRHRHEQEKPHKSKGQGRKPSLIGQKERNRLFQQFCEELDEDDFTHPSEEEEGEKDNTAEKKSVKTTFPLEAFVVAKKTRVRRKR